jgi:AAA15 family ATPase/GTPase
MRTYLTIKNYRCFVRPVTVQIAKGFTAFVGLNNAGKSTIMRFLLEFRPSINNLINPNLIMHLLNGNVFNLALLHVLDNLEVFSNLNSGDIEFTIRFVYENEETVYLNNREEEYTFIAGRNMQVAATLTIDGATLRTTSIGVINDLLTVNGKPVSRLRPLLDLLSSLCNTLYIGPFRNTINAGTKTDYLDIQIGQSFIAQFRELKTGSSKKSNTDISRLTEDIRNVFRFQSLDIAPTADNLSLHLTVNGKPYKQHELGSGLAHFVIVLVNAALKNPKWILIDEPELNLHPALQLDFLTTLARYAEEGVWFSSHSIGLARSAALQVYSVTRVGEGDSEIRPLTGTPRLSEFLGEMSFSSHKELGFEKILLVEGPTEVPTIQQFLRMIGKDHQILLLPLHGHMPKVDEFEEILRISTDVAALIDSERISADAPLNRDRQEFLNLCARNGLMSHALDRRATENYFPEQVVKRVFGASYRALAPYEKLSDASPRWSKSQNWKMAADMTFDDIRATDLGAFLEAL